jgi:hypothetical protein
MPTHMRGFFSVEEKRTAQLAPPFSFTKGCPVLRINAAARLHQMSYSALMHGLKIAGVHLDRKILADLAVRDPSAFGRVVTAARQAASGA